MNLTNLFRIFCITIFKAVDAFCDSLRIVTCYFHNVSFIFEIVIFWHALH